MNWKRMLRAIFVGLCLSICCLGLPRAMAASPVVWLDGEQLAFDVPPVLEKGRTLVPYRAVFEKLGYTVSWNAAARSVSAIQNDASMWMQIGNRDVTVNGKNVRSDAAPVIRNGRTFVPLRLISEYSGCDVLWDGETQTVAIYHRQANNAQSLTDGCVTTDGASVLVPVSNWRDGIFGTWGFSLRNLSEVGFIPNFMLLTTRDGIGYGYYGTSISGTQDKRLQVEGTAAVDMATGKILTPPIPNLTLFQDCASKTLYSFSNSPEIDQLDPDTLSSSPLSQQLPDTISLISYVYDGKIFSKRKFST